MMVHDGRTLDVLVLWGQAEEGTAEEGASSGEQGVSQPRGKSSGSRGGRVAPTLAASHHNGEGLSAGLQRLPPDLMWPLTLPHRLPCCPQWKWERLAY